MEIVRAFNKIGGKPFYIAYSVGDEWLARFRFNKASGKYQAEIEKNLKLTDEEKEIIKIFEKGLSSIY